jgi:uncharacterized oxidoreductase
MPYNGRNLSWEFEVMKLTGQTVLITGGTSGIGFELAKVLLAMNNKVIITGRNAERLEKTKSLLPKVETVVSDVSKSEDIAKLAAHVLKAFPTLNILINNAGIMNVINLHRQDMSDKVLTEEIETNLNGPIRMVHAFLPHLKKQSEAAIVNVTSGLAFVPLPTSPVYCATKAALHSYTRSLRAQMFKTKVKIFELAPPATHTPILSKASEEDMKGITIMPVEKMVQLSIAGIERDQYEIRPGQSNQLKFMNRVAPDFIFKQLSRPVERMLSK